MKKVITKILFLSLIGVVIHADKSWADSFSRTIRIEGRKEAVVSTPIMRLSDLADVSSERISDDDTVIALKKIEIGPSPAAGEETTIPAAKILERLQQERVDLNAVTYILPRVLKIKRASRSLSVDEIRAAIINYFSENGRDVIIKSIDYQGDKQVLPGTTDFELTPFNTLKPQEIGFTVRTKSGEDSGVRFNIKAFIDEWLEIPVAKRNVTRGAQIGPDDFVMARLNLGALPNDAARNSEEVLGLEANSEIAPGEIFRKNKLFVPPIISQGSKVTLIYKKGILEARATGIALEDGGAGEEIKIRNDASKKIVSGKVLEEGLVGVN